MTISVDERPDGNVFRCSICKLNSGPPVKGAKYWSHRCVRDALAKPCQHLGNVTEEVHTCKGCSKGSPRVHALFECELHGRCLPLSIVEGVRCCRSNCDDYKP